jgi:hypothetical protein
MRLRRIQKGGDRPPFFGPRVMGVQLEQAATLPRVPACRPVHPYTSRGTPPGLVEPIIAAGTLPGDLVLDPFAGTGTTCKVAHKLGRRWLGIELNPRYAAMGREIEGR